MLHLRKSIILCCVMYKTNNNNLEVYIYILGNSKALLELEGINILCIRLHTPI